MNALAKTKRWGKRSIGPLVIAGVASLTIGLAPFWPQPHIAEKLGLLVRGELVRIMDILDLLLHGLPWLVLLVLVVRFALRR